MELQSKPIEIAIETAETGHLVFGTLHTSTAPSTACVVVSAASFTVSAPVVTASYVSAAASTLLVL